MKKYWITAIIICYILIEYKQFKIITDLNETTIILDKQIKKLRSELDLSMNMYMTSIDEEVKMYMKNKMLSGKDDDSIILDWHEIKPIKSKKHE